MQRASPALMVVRYSSASRRAPETLQALGEYLRSVVILTTAVGPLARFEVATDVRRRPYFQVGPHGPGKLPPKSHTMPLCDFFTHVLTFAEPSSRHADSAVRLTAHVANVRIITQVADQANLVETGHFLLLCNQSRCRAPHGER